MSLFDAFVGGAADQATGILDRQMKEEADLERQKQLTQFQADLAEAKMRTTAAIQRQLAQQDADMMTSRVGQNAEKAGQDWYDKQNFGDPDIGDPSALTEEQQSVINQAMTKRQQDLDLKINSYKNNPRSMVQAKVELGQESPDKLMTFDQKDQSLAMQQGNLDRQKAALDESIRHHQENEDIRRDANDIKAQLAEIKANGGSKDETIKYLTQQRTTATQDLNASLHAEDMAQKSIKDHYLVKPEKGGNKNYEQELEQWKQELQEKKDALKRRQEASEDARKTVHDVSNLFKQYTTTPSKPDNGIKSPAPTSSIPSGYTIIGQTPKGQTVYRTPDGKTVVSKG